jgi:hypothetical protein
MPVYRQGFKVGKLEHLLFYTIASVAAGTGWTTQNQCSLRFNPALYPSIKRIYLSMIGYAASGQSISVRLIDLTNNSPIPESTITITGPTGGQYPGLAYDYAEGPDVKDILIAKGEIQLGHQFCNPGTATTYYGFLKLNVEL